MNIWQRITSWLGGGISVVVYIIIIALFLIGVFLHIARDPKYQAPQKGDLSDKAG